MRKACTIANVKYQRNERSTSHATNEYIGFPFVSADLTNDQRRPGGDPPTHKLKHHTEDALFRVSSLHVCMGNAFFLKWCGKSIPLLAQSINSDDDEQHEEGKLSDEKNEENLTNDTKYVLVCCE